MSLKHLGPDSEFIPLTKGKLRLYSMVFCPYAKRARLVLAHKNIPYETVNIKLNKKPQWYLQLNPAGQVPCLQFDDGRVIPDSLIVCDYLDNAYPQNKLTPSDPYTNAQHKLLIESCSKLITSFYKVFKDEPDGSSSFFEALEMFEKKLQSKFFGGDQVQMVDYMIWTWIEKIEYLEYIGKFKFDSAKLPKIHKYIKTMNELKAVKETYIPAELVDKFAKTMATGEPDYDLGLQPIK